VAAGTLCIRGKAALRSDDTSLPRCIEPRRRWRRGGQWWSGGHGQGCRRHRLAAPRRDAATQAGPPGWRENFNYDHDDIYIFNNDVEYNKKGKRGTSEDAELAKKR
jgi:hypothetical protein